MTCSKSEIIILVWNLGSVHVLTREQQFAAPASSTKFSLKQAGRLQLD